MVMLASRNKWPLLIAGGLPIVYLLFFFNLGQYETLATHESYVAVPAREMLQTGNWIVPEFGGLPRLQKPPLAYWVTASVYWLFSEISEWTARFPSAVSGILLSLLMGVWGSQWYGKKVGILAALIQMTSFYSMKYSHRATVDIQLCLLITLALYLVSGDQPAQTKKNSFWRWLGIYVLISLSFLAKFHYGPAMILGPAFVYFVVQKRFVSLWHLLNPAGLFLFGCSVFIWPYLILTKIPEAWDLWKFDAVARSFIGSEPVWFYIQYLFLYSLPWIPLSFFAIKKSWLDAWNEKDPRERFLWVWLFTQFAMITLSATKRSHYLIPVLPVFSLFTARYLSGVIGNLSPGKPFLNKKQVSGFSLLFLIAAGIICWTISRRWDYLNHSALLLAALFGVGGTLATWLLHKGFYKSVAVTSVCFFMGCFLVVYSSILPGMDRRRAEADFSLSVVDLMKNNQPVCAYMLGMDSVIYYLGPSAYRIEDSTVLKQQLENKSPLYIVTRQPSMKNLSEIGTCHTLKKYQQSENSARARNLPLVFVELTPSQK
jgi:4-amino-4-deoxy-L-arabinose transferase-like glycosyltransferase